MEALASSVVSHRFFASTIQTRASPSVLQNSLNGLFRKTLTAGLPSSFGSATHGCFRCRARSSLRVTAVASEERQQQARLRGVSDVESDTPLRQVLVTTKYDEGVVVEAAKVGSVVEVDVWAGDGRARWLHWGVDEWSLPAADVWPQGTVKVDDKAVQSPFRNGSHVRITFSEDTCPKRVVFVIKETEPEERWLNNGGLNYAVQLQVPQVQDVTDKIIESEAEYDRWSLFSRFQMATQVIDALDAGGMEGMGFLYTWLRLSHLRQLPWYGGINYQTKDLVHTQLVLAEQCAAKAASSADPWGRVFARMTMAGLPRGGGDADAIRMGILHIMRDHNIREGHRPGLEEKFLEQWHQKLHTNTSPDDVTICEAYLAFLYSGNMDDFWRVLWDNGRMSRETLTTMDHPISAYPLHLPYLIPAFEHFLWILKVTHAGADMDTALEMSKGFLGEELRWQLGDLLANRNEWWVPGKIVELRDQLQHYWKGPSAQRDLLLLDISLDNYFRTCIERQDKQQLSRDDLVEMVTLILRNGVIAAESEELSGVWRLWERLRGSGGRWGDEWALQALAAAQVSQLSLATYMDTIYEVVQPIAERFQAACKMDQKYITNFGEEVVRGHPLFVLSLMLKQLEPHLRQAADVGSWQVVSQSACPVGYVTQLPSMESVQGCTFEEATILLVDQVGGMEDLPQGVVAVLTPSATDVLSHIAIRARSQGVLLASCFDDSQFQALRSLQGTYVGLKVSPTGDVYAGDAEGSAAMSPPAPGNAPRIAIPVTRRSAAWAVRDVDYEEGTVGGKAANLAALRNRLPDWISVPASVALPFGTFERVLAAEGNQQSRWTLAALEKELEEYGAGSGVPPTLSAIRELVTLFLQPPEELFEELSYVSAQAGLIPRKYWSLQPQEWQEVWLAVCKVWASKWSDRAWLSRRASGVGENEVQMSVLLQQVVPAEYAFVVHTAHPLTGQRGEMVGEVVAGLGETLVSNHPGRPLSFCAVGPDVRVLSLPSKRLALYCPPQGSLIARSDTNAEDLPEFAGAGLYDSVLVSHPESRAVDYAAEPLLWDGAFRGQLLGSMAQLGQAVEAAFRGDPQDIEGCWAEGRLHVVQSRPQVLSTLNA